MKALEDFLNVVSSYVWGAPLIILLIGAGIYLTVRLRFLPVRHLLLGFRITLGIDKDHSTPDEGTTGDISQFQSLMTALAATIGTGNIVGVATAIASGGPGALFWMWVSAFFGMATKYSEAILAVRFRETRDNGEMAGGPMYYIKNGMHNKWLAALFAFFGAMAAFGIGSTVQANSVASAIKANFNCDLTYVAIALTVLTAAVVLGGISSIGQASSYIVPFMAVLYTAGGLFVIFTHLSLIPGALAEIFSDAFTGQAVAGGAVGTVIRFGVARGIFSNEAGLGSAPIAAAAAKVDMPGRQALVSMLGTFIDTIIVCSMTGLVVVMSGMWKDAAGQGVVLTGKAFEYFLPGYGNLLVGISLIFFAYSTILGWCYYGEKCFEYLLGHRIVKVYRGLYAASVYVGSVSALGLVWTISDIFNALMAFPNLIALIALSSVIVEETDLFEAQLKKEKLKS